MRPKEQNWSSVATRREVPAAVRSSERQGNRLPLLSGNSPAHTLTQPRSLASGSRRDLFLLLRATELLFSPTLCEPADGSTPGRELRFTPFALLSKRKITESSVRQEGRF